jgi:hypothetical protein
MRFSFLIAVSVFMTACCNTQTDVWLRVNQAGYTPDRVKTAIVLSDRNIDGRSWSLKSGKKVVLSGKLGAAQHGDNHHVAQPFYYAIDFSPVKENGVYSLELAGASAVQVRILPDPYSLFATQALMHLRAMRSGIDTRLHKASHLGDSVAIVYQGKGDWADGAWQEATPRRTVEMRGGHYDAGNYLKFTLTEAYLVWHLLTAYQENPSLFTKTESASGLPDILDEAKHGLDYLAKTFPDNNTFVIQVGNGDDHNEVWRMPDMDKLEGKRPALCALSRVHMGSAAAALALGAQVFQRLDADAATIYGDKAKAIYARAKQNDTQRSAFESNDVNAFYRDETDTDNMALAAAELFRLTGQQNYLDEGMAYAPETEYAVSWARWNSFANHLLAKLGDAAAKKRMLDEVANSERDNLWNVPGDIYTWGTLYGWIGMANAHLRAQRDLQDVKQLTVPFRGILDYVFGRNNWGIAMLVSPDLPYSIRNAFGGIYRLTGAYPIGALSEGPTDKTINDELKVYFPAFEGKVSEDHLFEKFNTATVVFYDDIDNFVIQETSIIGQGNFLLMLALASKRD